MFDCIVLHTIFVYLDNKVFDQLIAMGYPQSISSIASKNSQNIHQAVEWIITNNDIEDLALKKYFF